MTEIALALAMGFFSIMVLTVISMGAAQQAARTADAAILAPSSRAATAVAVAPNDMIVVYHGGRFLDAKLQPVDPATIRPAGRLILAIDPVLPLGEAMAARARFTAERLVVSTLDADWLKALQEGDR